MNKTSIIKTKLSRYGHALGKHMTEQEYFEWVNPYLYSLAKPLGILILIEIASILCGFFVAPQGFVVSASILSVIVVGCFWPWIGIRGVSCQLSFAVSRTEEGKPVEAELVVANRWPWPVWGLAIEGGFDHSDEEERAEVAISRIGGWSKGKYRWSFTPRMRGQYPHTCPELVTEFPFGLWKAKKPIEVLSKVIAWPMRFPLPELPLPAGAPSWVGQPSENAAGVIGHRTTVREYQSGDSMRQIHWAKTALYDKLISYEREGIAVMDATITLDAQPSIHPNRGPDSTLEWTFRIAASIGDALLRQGITLTLISPSSIYRSSSNGSNCSKMLDWLAILDVDKESSYDGAKRYSGSNSLEAISIHITTDLAEATNGNSIVLRTSQENSNTNRMASTSSGWITVEQNSDIPRQIRNGWRSGPRKVRYAY